MPKREVKGEIKHGSPWTYKDYGCRCVECKNANTARQKAMRDDLQRRGQENPELIPHGTSSGYINWRCRCDDCRAYSRSKKQKSRQAERETTDSGTSGTTTFASTEDFLAFLDGFGTSEEAARADGTS